MGENKNKNTALMKRAEYLYFTRTNQSEKEKKKKKRRKEKKRRKKRREKGITNRL